MKRFYTLACIALLAGVALPENADAKKKSAAAAGAATPTSSAAKTSGKKPGSAASAAASPVVAKPAATATAAAATPSAKPGSAAVSAAKFAPGAAAAARSAAAAPKSGPVDINSASQAELETIPGIGPAYAQKIIAGRPYKMKNQLASRKIVPDAVYAQIQARIIAKQK